MDLLPKLELPLLAVRVVALFLYALAFAAVEIEIEGEDGWAERLPTWYRVTPWYARLFAWVMSGKPLTGYHAVMFFIPLSSFHLGFVFGLPWSGRAEAQVLAAYLIWNVTWDFLWFVLNPRYTLARFRPGAIWWHARWRGPVPADYWNGLLVSIAIAALPWLLRGDRRVLQAHLVLTVGLAALTAATIPAASAYGRWYRRMRRPGADERALVIKAPGADGPDPR